MTMFGRIFYLFGLLVAFPVCAEDIYQQPEAFVAEAFGGNTPEVRELLFSETMRPNIDRIMERNYPIHRTRYWQKGTRTAWVLDEIGKVKPITAGVVVEDGRIAQVKVLIYRESHGAEIRQAYFTGQFADAILTPEKKLSRAVDTISGATMSSQALRNLAKLALYLDQQVNPPSIAP